jgi:hypothetical protein
MLGHGKRYWGIQMNDARELYLKMYGINDTIDKYISNTNIGYRSWKYWHTAMNHAKVMGLAVAYDMYKECAARGWFRSTVENQQAGIVSQVP